MDYYEGSFQDFVGHSDKLSHVKFAASSKLLFTIADSELFVWRVCVWYLAHKRDSIKRYLGIVNAYVYIYLSFVCLTV